MKPKEILIIAYAVLQFSVTIAFAQIINDFKIVKNIKIAGDGSWDYLTVDEPSKMLYVSHGNQVDIINFATGNSVGMLKNTLGVHGIALVKSLNKGYTSNGKDNSCTVFSLDNKEELKKISTGENPDAIFYDDFSKLIFVFNGKSKDATVIDPISDKVVATIALGEKPETGVSNGKGLVYVNLETSNEVAVLDTKTFKVNSKFKVNEGDEPSGLAIDRATNRLFVGCGGNGKLVIMDALNGKNIAHFPIGDCDGVVFDTVNKNIYSSNREGTISVVKEISANNYRQLKSIITEKGAKTIALNAKSHHLFTSTALTEEVKPTAENPKPRPKIVPATFHVLEIGN